LADLILQPAIGVRDSTDVLDGLLYHKSDLRIEEHYTDTAVRHALDQFKMLAHTGKKVTTGSQQPTVFLMQY
jgi:TnpA family transposase